MGDANTIGESKEAIIEDINKEKSGDPKDKNRFVYAGFYYVGLTIMFPYIMLITVTDFWNFKFRNISVPFNSSSDEFTDLQMKFPGYISITGNVPLPLMVILTVIFGWKISLKRRLILTSIIMVLCFAFIVTISSMDTDTWQDSLLILMLVTNTFYSSINAVFQASFLGNIGRFPPNYIGSANDGMGLGTTLPALVSIMILATNPEPETVGIVCIACAMVTLFMMIPLLVKMSQHPFYKYHAGTETEQKIRPSLKDYITVLKATSVYTTVILVDFTLTLAVHPAVTALVKPVSSQPTPWNDKYFVPVSCFLVQAVFDWIGRSLATLTQWPSPGRRAEIGCLICVFLRAGFIPLIMGCYVLPVERNTPILFKSDWAYIGFFAAFNIVGGYISNVGLMLGPKKVGVQHQEVAGSILILALVIGLGIGSLIGPLLVELL